MHFTLWHTTLNMLTQTTPQYLLSLTTLGYMSKIYINELHLVVIFHQQQNAISIYYFFKSK